jgi:hypothetical protein
MSISKTQPGITLTFLLKRNPSFPYPTFKVRYRKHMGDVIPILKKYNCSHYAVQFFSTNTHQDVRRVLGASEDAAIADVLYDAVATLKFPDLELFKVFMVDEEHRRYLERDGDMVSAQQTVVLSGEEVVGI